jgi:transcriptional regulator with XRE-family HTH domain
MIERILKFMTEKKLSPSQFADEIGIQRSGMSHLISGRNKPSLEFIMKVLKRFPEIKADYLLYGIAAVESDEPTELRGDADIPPRVPATLFELPVSNETPILPKPQKPVKEEREERKAEKIVIFYDDRTFREYLPE